MVKRRYLVEFGSRISEEPLNLLEGELAATNDARILIEDVALLQKPRPDILDALDRLAAEERAPDEHACRFSGMQMAHRPQKGPSAWLPDHSADYEGIVGVQKERISLAHQKISH